MATARYAHRTFSELPGYVQCSLGGATPNKSHINLSVKTKPRAVHTAVEVTTLQMILNRFPLPVNTCQHEKWGARGSVVG